MVKVDLAGVSVDDLEIVLSNSQLIIRGCRRDTFYREGYLTNDGITTAALKSRLSSPVRLMKLPSRTITAKGFY